MIFSADQRRRPRRFFRLRGVVRRLRRPEAGIPSGHAGSRQSTPTARSSPSGRASRQAWTSSSGSPAGAKRRCVASSAVRPARSCAGGPTVGSGSSGSATTRASGSACRHARCKAPPGWRPASTSCRRSRARTTARSSRGRRHARSARSPSRRTRNGGWRSRAARPSRRSNALVLRARQPDGVPADPDGEPNEIDGEPAVRWRFTCPARVRALWRRALELASRAAGEPLSDWRAVEIVAAEGSSGRPLSTSIGDRALLRGSCAWRAARANEAQGRGRTWARSTIARPS